ncbi:MAG: TctA family transporter, partial [Dokdonia sp.]
MKTIKLTRLFTVLFALVTLVSCVQDDDFSVPELDAGALEIEGQSVSINSVAGQVAQAVENENE